MSNPADFANVELICHFNGTDGATTYTPDVGGGTFTMYGGCELDTAVKKFGTASLLGAGETSYCDYGYVGQFDFFHTGVEDFTIECFVNIGTGNTVPIIDTAPAALNDAGFTLQVLGNGTVLLQSRDGSGVVVAQVIAAAAVPTSTMSYLAVVYENGVGFEIFVEAVSQATGTYTGLPSANNSEKLAIGRVYSATTSDINGHIDSLRIVKNEALTITGIPATEFPTSGVSIITGTGAGEAGFSSADGSGTVNTAPAGWVLLPSVLDGAPVSAYGYQDLTTVGSGQSARFVMDITGTPTLRIPVSSWQGTLSDGIPGYLQAVIPNSIDYEAEIATRLGDGESFKIYRQIEVDGVTAYVPVMDALLDNVATYRGPFRATVVLAGYPTYNGSTSTTRTMTNIRTWNSSSNGKYRARCDIDYYLNPGDIADVDGYQFEVDYINYYAPTSGDIYMDIGAR